MSGSRDEAAALDNVPEDTEIHAMSPAKATPQPSRSQTTLISSAASSKVTLNQPEASTGSSTPTASNYTHKPQQQQHHHHHHHSLSESAHHAKSAIKSTFKKLHSSPSLTPQGTATPVDSRPSTPTGSNTPESTSSPSRVLPKRAHTFSIHRRKTIGSHDATPPSAQAQARQQAASTTASPGGSVPFSFGSGVSKLGTTHDLNNSANISSYQSSQRPVPQSALETRRTFSLSKLSSKLKTGGTSSANVTRDELNTSSFRVSMSSRNTTNDSTSTTSSAVSTNGREKVSPSEFLPTDLQVKDWSLTSKYSWSKMAVVSKGTKVLGKGATATVKIVHANIKLPDGTKQLFAAKVYNKCSPGENLKEHYSKLADEYIITHRLRHRNIVRIHDLCLDSSNSWCAIMDYCEGGDLFSLVDSYKASRRKMPKEERNCLFKQLLLGVNYIHSQGIAHRDIKPENLLITSKGELKISDFGVSIVVFDITKGETEKDARKTNSFAGSIPYLPPEVFETKKDPKNKSYDARLVDIWSCACTYINLVIGGGFFSKASIEEDQTYVRFIRELDRYWQHEKGVHSFLIAEGETNIEQKVYNVIVNNAASTAKILQQVQDLNDQESDADEVEASTAADVSRASTTSSTTTQSSDGTSSEKKLSRSDIMNMTEEQQPLFFFNEFGEAGKRLLARMLLPDPELRPPITDIMSTSVIKRLCTCVPDDTGPLGVKLPSSTTDFKKFKDQNTHLLHHTHKLPAKPPSLLGLGFKDPYKDYF